MTIFRHTHVLMVLSAALPVPAFTAPERIGAWVLDCAAGPPDTPTCQLRAAQRFVDQGGITGDLEVEAQGKSLVPVLALRGLRTELLLAAAIAGKVEASVEFPGSAPQDLTCAASSGLYVCAPGDHAAKVLAARLPTARSVTVRVSITIPGINPLPAQERSLTLSGTTDALARLRSMGALSVPRSSTPESAMPDRATEAPSQTPAGLAAMADEALKAAGYQNGVAGLRQMLAQYLRK